MVGLNVPSISLCVLVSIQQWMLSNCVKGEKIRTEITSNLGVLKTFYKTMDFVKELAKNSVVQCRFLNQFFGFFQNWL